MQDDGNVTVEVELLMDPSGYLAAACVLFLIGFFGFFMNLFTMIILWHEKELWTPLNVILCNLICSDFAVSIFGNPWTLLSALSYGWIFGTKMCIMYGFIMSLLGITSITTLTVLAMERYLMVAKPTPRKRVSYKNTSYLLFGVWSYSLMLTTPPLMGWGRYEIEAANISCSVNWEDRSYNTKTYIIYLFVFGLAVPLVIIVFCYTHIIATVRRKNMAVRGQLSRMEARIAYTVLVMIAAFLLAWTPYAVFALLVQFGDPTLVTPSTGVLPALLAKSSICYNPIIYVGLNSQFRQTVKRSFFKATPQDIKSTCETYNEAMTKYYSGAATVNQTEAEVTENMETVELTIRESKSISPEGYTCV